MPRFLFLTALLALGLIMPSSARAQAPVQIVEIPVEYTFGDHIIFRVQVITATPIDSVTVLFGAPGDAAPHSGPAQIAPDGTASYRFDSSQNALPPFALVAYSFMITLQGDQQVATEQRSFRYSDNRFQWQGLEDSILHVYWYAGDANFGQNAFDVAHLGLQRIAEVLTVTQTEPIDVYVYASAADIQSALGPGTQAWVAGHANPVSGVAMASIPVGQEQNLEMERQIPHELAHILLYRATGDAYPLIPAWLNEGIASSGELYPNPDYAGSLSQAVKDGSLIPMAELCGSFPPDSTRAFLAYAESQSFTTFLRDKYGLSGLANLINGYADGLDCDQGPTRALGRSLADLEREWRERVLGENPFLTGLANTGPYLVLLVLVLLVPVWRGSIAGLAKKPATPGNTDGNKAA